MKKKILFVIFIIIIAPIIIIIGFNNSCNKLKLTDEELKYIEENRDTIFFVGYFPTPAERRFTKKLCEKIEDDTSLQLRIYDDTWNNTLTLLRSSNLPIVTNMNKTEEREDYAFFTEPLTPIDCGIYSSIDNAITSFEDIRGKVIGAEKETALSESFPNEYPNIDYTLKIYDTFKETRQAFENKEIDGFLSTKSYDENVKGLHFFKIDSITLDTNHVGVSKDYPVLYSIISKEIKILINQNWDKTVSEVINFELEKTLVEFTEDEKEYLKQKDAIVVGIPAKYHLYYEEEEYNPKGAIPEILKKIEFISNANFIYEFDSTENLRLREDIDFYVDYENSKNFSSTSLFSEEIIIASTPDKKSIKETFELSIYTVGIFGAVNATQFLIKDIPNINITEYTDIKNAIKDIRKENIDYLIMPRIYYENYYENLSLRGDFHTNVNMFVSDDEMIINIIDKCLFIINTDRIVENEVVRTIPKKVPYSIIIFIVSILVIMYVVFKILKKIFDLYLKNNDYGLYNIKYLEKAIKNESYTFIFLELSDLDIIKFHYGDKIFEKYIDKFIKDVKLGLNKNEYLIYINENRLLVAINSDVQENISMLENISKISINNISLKYKKHICYYDFETEENINNVIKKMNIGFNISKEKDTVIHLTEQKYKQYKDKISNDIKIKNAIEKEAVDINYLDVVDNKNQKLGVYIEPKCGSVSQTNLYKIAKRLKLEIKLDKIIISKTLKESLNKSTFVKVSERTLVSHNFFDWLVNIVGDKTIFLICDFEVYEENVDILVQNYNIKYIVDSFGVNLKDDCNIKYLDIEYIILDKRLDIEDNSEIIEFIKKFAKVNNKKIISHNEFLTGCDYYIKEKKSENINS